MNRRPPRRRADRWRKRFKQMQAALARTAESLRLHLRYQDKGYTWFAAQDRPEAEAALEEARELLGLTKENCFFVPGGPSPQEPQVDEAE